MPELIGVRPVLTPHSSLCGRLLATSHPANPLPGEPESCASQSHSPRRLLWLHPGRGPGNHRTVWWSGICKCPARQSSGGASCPRLRGQSTRVYTFSPGWGWWGVREEIGQRDKAFALQSLSLDLIPSTLQSPSGILRSDPSTEAGVSLNTAR